MELINQKEYLKRYLSGSAHKKKKKNKKLNVTSNRVKIIDDDIDISKLTSLEAAVDAFGANEDAPQIVGVIDERPMHLRIDDYRKSDLWKPVGEQENATSSNSINFKLSMEKVKTHNNPRQTKENKKHKLYMECGRSLKGDDSDCSPLRKSSKDTDNSPPRLKRRDSDYSPPRRSIKIENNSPPHRRKSDSSPPRRNIKDQDNSPPRLKRRDSDSSPPRKNDSSLHRRKDSDNSPPRRSVKNRDGSPSWQKRRKFDSSPPRQKRRDSKSVSSEISSKTSGDKFFSSSTFHEKKTTYNKKPPLLVGDAKGKYMIPAKREILMSKTLDGKKAGLQNAQEIIKENEDFRKREDEVFKNMSSEVTGVNATAVVRDRKTGKIRDFQKEAQEKEQQEKEAAKDKEQYSRWGRGLKQVEDYENKLAEDMHEMNKPLARYADDEDLERFLKEQERDGDPMLDYIRKKRKKQIIDTRQPVKPLFEGEFMPNRFGIVPGHRWDGVDRSNGYEKKWIDAQNAKAVQQEEVYRWDTEDM